MMKRVCAKLTAVIFAFAVMIPSYSPAVLAEVIGAEAVLKVQSRATILEQAEAFVLQDVVANQLSQLGVDQKDILERIRALTDDELATLSNKIEEMPAGAGAIEILGVVFLVLLILELVGITDIFKKI